MSGRGCDAELFGVGQPLGADGELGVLTGLGRSLLDVGELCPQVVGLTGARIALGGELGQLAVDRTPALVRIAVRRQRPLHHVAAEAVQRVALRRRGAQPQLVGLAVHHHEFVGEIGQDARGCRAATHRRATAALARDRPADVQFRAAVAEGSTSPPASRTRSATEPDSGTIQTPSTVA
nr:hypothetical protein GCM10025699_23190 [Microbacterium flavescens]